MPQSYTCLAIGLALLIAPASALSSYYGSCDTGKSRLELVDWSKLSTNCVPKPEDKVATAVFKCMSAWKAKVSNCAVSLRPSPKDPPVLKCGFLSSHGLLSSGDKATLQAVIDQQALKRILSDNPSAVTALGGNSEQLSQLVEQIVDAVKLMWSNSTQISQGGRKREETSSASDDDEQESQQQPRKRKAPGKHTNKPQQTSTASDSSSSEHHQQKEEPSAASTPAASTAPEPDEVPAASSTPENATSPADTKAPASSNTTTPAPASTAGRKLLSGIEDVNQSPLSNSSDSSDSSSSPSRAPLTDEQIDRELGITDSRPVMARQGDVIIMTTPGQCKYTFDIPKGKSFLQPDAIPGAGSSGGSGRASGNKGPGMAAMIGTTVAVAAILCAAICFMVAKSYNWKWSHSSAEEQMQQAVGVAPDVITASSPAAGPASDAASPSRGSKSSKASKPKLVKKLVNRGGEDAGGSASESAPLLAAADESHAGDEEQGEARPAA